MPRPLQMILLKYFFMQTNCKNKYKSKMVDLFTPLCRRGNVKQEVSNSIPKSTNINDILRHINGIHTSISFTHELPHNSSIPFLDSLVSWKNSSHLCLLY